MSFYDHRGRPVYPKEPLFLGSCLGVIVEGSIVTLAVEDDENWFIKDISFHKHWIPDLIRQLEKAAKALGTEA